MNARLSKCQSMPADAHWDLEHHRFHCTNKCSRTWQGSCRLCKGRKTCQGWFSYRLGERWGEEKWGRLAKHWVLGEAETQSISLQPGRSVPPSSAPACLIPVPRGRNAPNPTASCQNVLTPTQAHPASGALCLAPECDGKIQSKFLPWELFPSSGKFAQAEWFTPPSKPPVQRVPMKFMVLSAHSTPFSLFSTVIHSPTPSPHIPMPLAHGLAVGTRNPWQQYCPGTSACQGSISQCLSWSNKGSTTLAFLNVFGLPARVLVRRQGLTASFCCKVPPLETREKQQ